MYFEIKRMSEKCRHCRQTGIIQRWQGFQRLQGVFFCRQKCRQNVYRKRLSSTGKALSVYILKPVCIQNALRMGDKDNILHSKLWIWTSETLLLFIYCAICTKDHSLSILHGFGMDKQKFRLLDIVFCAVF